jgi:hypothetical protein
MQRLIGIALGLALLGGLSIYHGTSRLWQTAHSSVTPETVPLATLLARGQTRSRYVRITDFRVGQQYAEVGRKSQAVRDAYVPIRPKSAGDKPPSGGGVAVIKTRSVVAQLAMIGDTFKGMANGLTTHPLAQKTLEEAYATDFPGRLVIELADIIRERAGKVRLRRHV